MSGAPQMLNTAEVARLRGVASATVRGYLARYPAGSDNPFPIPDQSDAGRHRWLAERKPEILAWQGTGQGVGGGRPAHRG